jgi:hypothetical protein
VVELSAERQRMRANNTSISSIYCKGNYYFKEVVGKYKKNY